MASTSTSTHSVSAWERVRRALGIRQHREPPRLTTRQRMWGQIEAMADYANARGIPWPVEVAARMDGLSADAPYAQLALVHAALRAQIDPATPEALLYLRTVENARSMQLLSPVPLLRGLMLAAIGLVTLFIALAAHIGPQRSVGLSQLEALGGWELVRIQLYFLSAAGVGAAFEGLFRAQAFVESRTYDQQYATTYWTRLLLGMVAGLVLALLIPIGSADQQTLTRPLLALLGGFSSMVVYRILNRFVETIDALVGRNAAEVEANERQSHERLEHLRERQREAEEQAANVGGPQLLEPPPIAAPSGD